jgi:hypothetical protein
MRILPQMSCVGWKAARHSDTLQAHLLLQNTSSITDQQQPRLGVRCSHGCHHVLDLSAGRNAVVEWGEKCSPREMSVVPRRSAQDKGHPISLIANHW